MSTSSDTIAAIATARGRAALGVVRISGPEAVPIAAACFEGANLREAASHTAHVGYVTRRDGMRLDQVVATVFRAPRSATGEDVVECSCHGGDFATRLILHALLEGGARLAAPGEFTQRAFLNGKMDLAQAEAVADLIHASSSLAHRVSVSHLQGRYSEALADIRGGLLELCAYLELELDFSEEDVAFADRERLGNLLERSERLLDALLQSWRLGRRVRDGVRVVIAGRPNAGKSTLLNALLGSDRAIVSPTPGTTRDEVEGEAEIGGLLFRFTDTAGLRDATDAIEAEGVSRAERAIDRSDILAYVYDVTAGMDAGEQAFVEGLTERGAPPVLLVANKTDLLAREEAPSDGGVFALSARRAFRDEGELQPLIVRLLETAGGDLSLSEGSLVVTNERHRRHLRKALDAVRAARQGLGSGSAAELLALDLRVALHEIGAITGEITNEDVLDQIFSRFCIGK